MTDNDDMLNDLLQPLRQKRRARPARIPARLRELPLPSYPGHPEDWSEGDWSRYREVATENARRAAAREAGLSRVPRVRTGGHSFRRYRRPATVAVACLIVAGIVGPPVYDALRYDQLVADVATTRAQVREASAGLQGAQGTFLTASEGALRTRGDIEAFVAVIDRGLLTSGSALDELASLPGALSEQADLREVNGTLSIPTPGRAPLLPGETDPATTSGLSLASRLNVKVALRLDTKRDELTESAQVLDVQMQHARTLTEEVLAAAADYGKKLRTYPKAETAAKSALRASIDQLTQSALDPIERFLSFQSAVAGAKASHIKVLREEAARKAAEEAAKKAAEEAARRAAEEAARRAEEERQRAETPTPTATPSVTPTPSPTSTPTATATPTPTPSSTPTPTVTPTPSPTVTTAPSEPATAE